MREFCFIILNGHELPGDAELFFDGDAELFFDGDDVEFIPDDVTILRARPS